MKSLRGSVLLGASLWTLGLLGVWSVIITIYGPRWTALRVVHAHGHVMVVFAAVALAGGYAVVRAGLAPFAELRRHLGVVRQGGARQLEGRYPTEVQPLVSDLNALLAHHEQAVGRALAKAGDLAHGLKTPLAVLAQEADQAEAAGHAELAAALGEQIERMRRQIEYHLAHARAAASGATPGARCAVAASAESLARTMLRLQAGRGLTIDVQTPAEHIVRCQREDLDEMLGNLLDNACKWARTRVSVTSTAVSDRVAILVDDDGPGIEAEMREAVLRRGVRADEAAPGSGFGLAIVQELAALYGGSIALSLSPLGGLRARLELPSAR